MKQTNKALKFLSQWLIYSFAASMTIVALIYIIHTDKLIYEVETLGIVPETTYRTITIQEYEAKKTWYNQKMWLTIICILGWSAFNPDFKQGLTKTWRDLQRWSEKLS